MVDVDWFSSHYVANLATTQPTVIRHLVSILEQGRVDCNTATVSALLNVSTMKLAAFANAVL